MGALFPPFPPGFVLYQFHTNFFPAGPEVVMQNAPIHCFGVFCVNQPVVN